MGVLKTIGKASGADPLDKSQSRCRCSDRKNHHYVAQKSAKKENHFIREIRLRFTGLRDSWEDVDKSI